jgi:hypothetical protein
MANIQRRDFPTAAAGLAAATTAMLTGPKSAEASDPSFMNNVPDPLLAGDELPTFKFELEKSKGKVIGNSFGKEATVEQLPISKGIAGVSMKLEPGTMRELHWHATAAERAFVIEGNVRTTVIDWFSRYVVAWRLSNTLDGSFCLEMLEEALRGGKPEVFNTDQGGAVHGGGIHGAAGVGRCGGEHGGAGAGVGQRVRRAAVEEREIRGYLHPGLRGGAGAAPGAGPVLRLLQRRAASSVAGLPDSGDRLLGDRCHEGLMGE